VSKERKKKKKKMEEIISTHKYYSTTQWKLSLFFFFFFYFFPPLFIFLFPAAEVIKPESKNHSQLLVPSPILSPSLSTDEDSSVYSPNSHDLLDDLLDWNGQQHTL
jgi:hypothetical protein